MAAALSFTPTVRSSLKEITSALTLEQVRDEVHDRASFQYPDVVVPMKRISVTDDGLVEVPGIGTLSLTPWSQSQLARMLGIRWEKWFSSSVVSPAERKEEIERRLSRLSGEWKIRASRCGHGENVHGDGTLRAFLGASYEPIDDARVFTRMIYILGGRANDLRFVRCEVTDKFSYYVALDIHEVDLGRKEPDAHHSGFILVNSEVGAGALSLMEYLWRLVCANGLILLSSGRKLFRKVHRRQEDISIDTDMSYALALLPHRWTVAQDLIRQAKDVEVKEPEAFLRQMLHEDVEARVYTEVVLDAYRAEPEPTRFGLVQAVTRAAQATSPDTRFNLERFAGRMLEVGLEVAT